MACEIETVRFYFERVDSLCFSHTANDQAHLLIPIIASTFQSAQGPTGTGMLRGECCQRRGAQDRPGIDLASPEYEAATGRHEANVC